MHYCVHILLLQKTKGILERIQLKFLFNDLFFFCTLLLWKHCLRGECFKQTLKQINHEKTDGHIYNIYIRLVYDELRVETT